MLSYKSTGKRSLDRPRKRWATQILGAAMDESPKHEVEEEGFAGTYSTHYYLHIHIYNICIQNFSRVS
jgi:hypothetical protein